MVFCRVGDGDSRWRAVVSVCIDRCGGSDPRASFLGTQAAFMGQAAFNTGEYLVEMLEIDAIGPFS
jgi:hypothetical protein